MENTNGARRGEHRISFFPSLPPGAVRRAYCEACDGVALVKRRRWGQVTSGPQHLRGEHVQIEYYLCPTCLVEEMFITLSELRRIWGSSSLRASRLDSEILSRGGW